MRSLIDKKSKENFNTFRMNLKKILRKASHKHTVLYRLLHNLKNVSHTLIKGWHLINRTQALM